MLLEVCFSVEDIPKLSVAWRHFFKVVLSSSSLTRFIPLDLTSPLESYLNGLVSFNLELETQLTQSCPVLTRLFHTFPQNLPPDYLKPLLLRIIAVIKKPFEEFVPDCEVDSSLIHVTPGSCWFAWEKNPLRSRKHYPDYEKYEESDGGFEKEAETGVKTGTNLVLKRILKAMLVET